MSDKPVKTDDADMIPPGTSAAASLEPGSSVVSADDGPRNEAVELGPVEVEEHGDEELPDAMAMWADAVTQAVADAVTVAVAEAQLLAEAEAAMEQNWVDWADQSDDEDELWLDQHEYALVIDLGDNGIVVIDVDPEAYAPEPAEGA